MSCIVWLATAVLISTAYEGVDAAARSLVAAGLGTVRAASPPRAGYPFCPPGCAEDGCVEESTSGGYYCQKCSNNLLVRKIDGLCGCAAGKYSPNGQPTCRDCPMQHYCEGGVYTETTYPEAIKCPGNMTTRGMRSSSSRACVNLPGFQYYNLNGLLLALICPANTYSPGLRKQIACVPCPTGFSTMGKTGQTLPSACVVPPGYYLKSPGQVAPCPTGEFKPKVGPEPNCQKCPFGVTTATQASTSNASCTMLLPGWYARSKTGSIVTTTAPCPQGYYCPGGPANTTFNPSTPAALPAAEGSIKRCPSGMWTVELASTAVAECLTPPGYKTANGVTVPCEAGAYRSGWTAPGLATSCVSCGVGVFADKTDRIIQYNLVTNQVEFVAVTTEPDDCYIMPGQGLYFETISNTWRARNCTSNSYGVDKLAYGLTPSPCKSCPQNMVTSTDNTTHPRSAAWYVSDAATATAGYTSPLACVNQAGFGYNGRVSQPCDRGTWSARDSHGTCVPCGYGLTTSAVGAGRTQADCGIAAGFGFDGANVVPCQIGTYNNASYQANLTSTCKTCPLGTSTAALGADDVALCNLCTGGWGGPGCKTQCGGKGDNATYGDEGRPMGTECTSCSWSSTGFSYSWQMGNDLFVAQAVAAIGADSAWDCVSEFAQFGDSAWYLPTLDDIGMNVTTNVDTFASCVAKCREPDCQYATYDYRARTCYIRIAEAPTYLTDMRLIALKAVPSGDVATNAFSVKASSTMVRHRHGAPSAAEGTDDTGSGSNIRSAFSRLINPRTGGSNGSSGDAGSSDPSKGGSNGSSGDAGRSDPSRGSTGQDSIPSSPSVSGDNGSGDNADQGNSRPPSSDNEAAGSNFTIPGEAGNSGSTDGSSGSTDGSTHGNTDGSGGRDAIVPTDSSHGRRLAAADSQGMQAASDDEARVSSLASGQYSFYIETNALTVGTQSPAPDRGNFKLGYAGLQQCLDACDDRTWCVGVTMLMLETVPESPRTCSLIMGNASPGKFIRTVTRADVNRLRVPTIFT